MRIKGPDSKPNNNEWTDRCIACTVKIEFLDKISGGDRKLEQRNVRKDCDC